MFPGNKIRGSEGKDPHEVECPESYPKIRIKMITNFVENHEVELGTLVRRREFAKT